MHQGLLPSIALENWCQTNWRQFSTRPASQNAGVSHLRCCLLVLHTSLLGLLFSGCMSAEAPDIESKSETIIGGVAGAVGDFPTTVAVFNGGLCTGTLIAPDLVLTAAHCITPSLLDMRDQAEVTANTRVILDVASLQEAQNGDGMIVASAETIPHPNFSINGLGDNDIGLIRLQTPVTDRAPTVINRIASDAPVGVAVKQVGYGASEVGGGSAGRLFSLASRTSISCASFQASDTNLLCFSQVDGKGKCQGDSGGPSFATIGGIERVVGVTSFGDQTCAQFGADTRVDAELDFLYMHAPELQCQADGACNEACDNNGLPVDEDCDVCEKDSNCEDMEVCEIATGDCIPAPFTPGGEGSECSGSDDCASELCATDDDGGLCTHSCSSDDDCADGLECASAGDQDICWPASEDSGWCSQGGGNKPAPFGILLVGLAMIIGLRRRRA